jgi:hypothetical protein
MWQVKTVLVAVSSVVAVAGFAAADWIAGSVPDTWAWTGAFVAAGAVLLGLMIWAISLDKSSGD